MWLRRLLPRTNFVPATCHARSFGSAQNRVDSILGEMESHITAVKKHAPHFIQKDPKLDKESKEDYDPEIFPSMLNTKKAQAPELNAVDIDQYIQQTNEASTVSERKMIHAERDPFAGGEVDADDYMLSGHGFQSVDMDDRTEGVGDDADEGFKPHPGAAGVVSEGTSEFHDTIQLPSHEEVQDAVKAFAPEGEDGDQEELDEQELTPAQLFYKENRDRLLARSQQYFLEKSEAEESEWTYYHDPVQRPPKGHLWDFTSAERDYEPYDVTEIKFPKHKLPTPEQIVQLLEREQCMDIQIIDLEACGRRDVGTYAIIGTGQTPKHCRRLGMVVLRKIEHLQIPGIIASCYGRGFEHFVTARAGPLVVHIMTDEERGSVNLEQMYLKPHEHFQADDFPHYVPTMNEEVPPYYEMGGRSAKGFWTNDPNVAEKLDPQILPPEDAATYQEGHRGKLRKDFGQSHAK